MMIRKLIMGTVISIMVVMAPVLGNTQIFHAPQIWILLSFGILASFLQPTYNPFTIATRPEDKGTAAQIIWSVYAVQLGAILEFAYLRYPAGIRWDVVAVMALTTMTLGLVLRTWAVVTLGQFFTMHIAVRDDHTIVRRGPYRLIRHPSYLGAFMLYAASTLFLHAWFSAAAAVVILPFAFLRRIHFEEKLLVDKLGEEYELYCSEVKKILPWIW